MIVDVLAEDVRNGSLMEFLYADDIVLCGESLNDVMGKYGKCKNAVERKGLRVNVDKIKVGSCYLGRKIVFRKWIFLVSSERVGCNSLQCTNCQRLFVVVLLCLGR